MELERRIPVFFDGSHSIKDNPIQTKESFAMRFFDGSISVSLIALFFGVPLFFTGATLQGIAFEKEIYFYFWLILAIIGWLLKGIVTGELRIRKTPLDIPILIMLIVYIGSAITSVDRFHSIWGSFSDPSRGLMNVCASIIAYYLIFSHVTLRRTHMMVIALVSAALVVVAWSILTVFGAHVLPAFLEHYAPVSLFGSMTALTIFLAACLPLFVSATSLLYESSTLRTTLKKVFIGIVFIGIISDIILLCALFPYVSWLATLFGFALFSLYIMARIVNINRHVLWLPMLILVVLLTIFMIAPAPFAMVSLPVEATPNMQLSWNIAKEALNTNPFLGSGPASYGYDFSLYRPQSYNQQVFSSLRFPQGLGLYFESVATIGSLGVIAMIIIELSFVSVGLFLLVQKKERNKMLSLGLWGMTFVLLFASITSPFNGSIAIVSVLVATLALAVLMQESDTDEFYRTLSLHASQKFALTLAFIFLLLSASIVFALTFIGKAFIADVLAARSLALSADALDDGAAKMTKATGYMPKESHYRLYASQIYMTLAVREAYKSKDERDENVIKKNIEMSRSFVKVAQETSLRDVGIQESSAQVYENMVSVTGMYQDILGEAQKSYEQALFLEPHNPLYYLKMGQIKSILAKSAKTEDQKTLIGESLNLFQKSVDENPEFAFGYLNLGLSQELSGNIDAAIASIAKSVSLNVGGNGIDEMKYNLARLLRIRGSKTDLQTAEILLQEIISGNDKNLNAQLILGLVYEQTGRKEDALAVYQKMDTLIADDDTSKKQIQIFINNVKAGKSNIPPAPAVTNPDNTSVSVTPSVTTTASNDASSTGSIVPVTP